MIFKENLNIFLSANNPKKIEHIASMLCHTCGKNMNFSLVHYSIISHTFLSPIIFDEVLLPSDTPANITLYDLWWLYFIFYMQSEKWLRLYDWLIKVHRNKYTRAHTHSFFVAFRSEGLTCERVICLNPLAKISFPLSSSSSCWKWKLNEISLLAHTIHTTIKLQFSSYLFISKKRDYQWESYSTAQESPMNWFWKDCCVEEKNWKTLKERFSSPPMKGFSRFSGM